MRTSTDMQPALPSASHVFFKGRVGMCPVTWLRRLGIAMRLTRTLDRR
mgnify:CR=1 FL=1